MRDGDDFSGEVKSVMGGVTEGGGVVSEVVSWLYGCELMSVVTSGD